MPSILFLSVDLARNSTYTPWQFAGALSSIHRTALAGPSSGELWPPARGEVAPVAVLPDSNPLSRRTVATLLDVARGRDLIYAFKAMPGSFGMALAARRRLGIPIALHLDDWEGGFFSEVSVLKRAWWALRDLSSPRGEAWLHLYERMVGRADLLTVSSRALQRRFGGTVVRQGVDTDRFSPDLYPQDEARRRLGIPEDRFVVLSLGTPRPHKGLNALHGLATKLLTMNGLVLVVGGNSAEGLGRGVEAGENTGPWFRPAVAHAEAARYLAAADLFVVPQRDTAYARHQLPGKMLFAMAMGTPVLAADVGDAVEVLGGEVPAGLVVRPEDPDALLAAVTSLACDERGRRAMGAEGRRRAVAELGWRGMASRLEELLRPLGLARSGASA